MADAFEHIFGQPNVREFLRSSMRQNRISHAYLFSGPAGSNKTLAAYALALALLCPKHTGERNDADQTCVNCTICLQVRRKKHPDVRYFAPEGANRYVIDQIRDIVSDANLAPIQASRKVYILDRADLLNQASANAFLKTLEEPPDDVVFILLGRTAESVLPTIVSRCQVVPFRHIPATQAAGILAQNTGEDIARARMSIEACSGSITKAAEFLKSKESQAFRKEVLDTLAFLRLADDWDIIEKAAHLASAAKAPLDEVRAAQEQELAEHADFFSKSVIRQIEKNNKRALSAKTLALYRQINAIVRSWLRDVLVVCAGEAHLVINVDVQEGIEEAAMHTNEANVTCALLCVSKSDDAIAYNVSPETCLDALLFEVRDALFASMGDARVSGAAAAGISGATGTYGAAGASGVARVSGAAGTASCAPYTPYAKSARVLASF